MHGKQVRVKTDLCLLNFSVKILSLIQVCVCLQAVSVRKQRRKQWPFLMRVKLNSDPFSVLEFKSRESLNRQIFFLSQYKC